MFLQSGPAGLQRLPYETEQTDSSAIQTSLRAVPAGVPEAHYQEGKRKNQCQIAYICAYICIQVYVYVYVCIYIYISICLSISSSIYIYKSMNLYIYISTYLYIYILYLYIYISIYLNIYIYRIRNHVILR